MGCQAGRKASNSDRQGLQAGRPGLQAVRRKLVVLFLGLDGQIYSTCLPFFTYIYPPPSFRLKFTLNLFKWPVSLFQGYNCRPFPRWWDTLDQLPPYTPLKTPISYIQNIIWVCRPDKNFHVSRISGEILSIFCP